MSAADNGSRIELVPAHADDLARPSPWLRLGMHDSPAEDFLLALEDVLAQVTKPPRPEPWGAFWATQSIDGETRAVGLCSYKTRPNEHRVVEIAYYTFPHRQGRGIATAMVRALTKRASSQVAVIVAHTLPVENESCRVLRRCGYQWMGEVIDPEGGLVWRWRRSMG